MSDARGSEGICARPGDWRSQGRRARASILDPRDDFVPALLDPVSSLKPSPQRGPKAIEPSVDAFEAGVSALEPCPKRLNSAVVGRQAAPFDASPMRAKSASSVSCQRLWHHFEHLENVHRLAAKAFGKKCRVLARARTNGIRDSTCPRGGKWRPEDATEFARSQYSPALWNPPTRGKCQV
jgi:hypothetical protein